MVKLENGQIYMYPVAEVEVESPYFSEMTTTVCIHNPFYDLMIGNVSGTVSLYQDGKYTCSEACAVTPRAGARRSPGKPVTQKMFGSQKWVAVNGGGTKEGAAERPQL